MGLGWRRWLVRGLPEGKAPLCRRFPSGLVSSAYSSSPQE